MNSLPTTQSLGASWKKFVKDEAYEVAFRASQPVQLGRVNIDLKAATIETPLRAHHRHLETAVTFVPAAVITLAQWPARYAYMGAKLAPKAAYLAAISVPILGVEAGHRVRAGVAKVFGSKTGDGLGA